MVTLLLDQGVQLDEEVLFGTQHFHIIKYLVKRGANPKAIDNNGNTLLHHFCKEENQDLKHCKYLIKHYSANVSTKNNNGETLLHSACKRFIINLEMVKFLIEELKADPAVTCDRGKTALHYAAEKGHLGILRYLIEEQKLDPEVTSKEGKTALHYAADYHTIVFLTKEQKPAIEAEDEGRHFPIKNGQVFYGGWETQKYLIKDQQQLIQAQDKNCKTALHYFSKKYEIENNNFKSIALIAATSAINMETKQNKDIDFVFDWIQQSYGSSLKKKKNDDDKSVISCLNAGLCRYQKQLCTQDNTNIGYNPLLYVVLFCMRVDIAEFMFNQDLDYIEKQKNKKNAEEASSKKNLLIQNYLRFSCAEGFLDLTRFLFEEIHKKWESFQHLMFAGDYLKTACHFKHINIFKYLLEDEKAKDEADEFLKDFPLHFACKWGSLDMVQYLIEVKNVGIETKNNKGQTALQCALNFRSIEIVEYLIEEKRACIDATTMSNVFQVACNTGSFELVKYIAEKFKLDIIARDSNGLTALHLACAEWIFGFEGLTYYDKITKIIFNNLKQYVDIPNDTGLKASVLFEGEHLKVVKFLFSEKKANLHLVDKKGRTPLHVACESNNLSIAKFLVRKGADVLAKDTDGKIPLQLAKDRGNKQLIPFLKTATKR
jgi:ankyrin repeat protein